MLTNKNQGIGGVVSIYKFYSYLWRSPTTQWRKQEQNSCNQIILIQNNAGVWARLNCYYAEITADFTRQVSRDPLCSQDGSCLALGRRRQTSPLSDDRLCQSRLDSDKILKSSLSAVSSALFPCYSSFLFMRLGPPWKTEAISMPPRVIYFEEIRRTCSSFTLVGWRTRLYESNFGETG